jgi:glycosyltransferase involved in cell wall biosynthesis
MVSPDVPEPDAGVSLSFVIPAHNSSAVIEDTLEAVAKRLADTSAEIIVVENGSTDDTRGILDRLSSNWPAGAPTLRVTDSAKGLGNALRLGILESTGRTVVIAADDLPFGFDDLDAAERLGLASNRIVIGSKAHPRSEIERPILRVTLTNGFRVLRWIILRMRTADPQGSYIIDGRWARAVAPSLNEPGFLFSTELAYAAEQSGIRPVEVPVRLRDSHHGTRIRISDIYKMGIGLLAVRRRRRALVRAGTTAPTA